MVSEGRSTFVVLDTAADGRGLHPGHSGDVTGSAAGVTSSALQQDLWRAGIGPGTWPLNESVLAAGTWDPLLAQRGGRANASRWSSWATVWPSASSPFRGGPSRGSGASNCQGGLATHGTCRVDSRY